MFDTLARVSGKTSMAIRPINGRQRKRKFLVYDLEWIPGTLEVRVVGCFDGNRYRWYRSVEAFLDHELSRENRNKWFYAHAGGLADVQFLLPLLIDSQNYSIDGCFSGSSAIILCVNEGKHSWTFCDSFWLLRDSLSNIGRSVGVAKTGPELLDLRTTEEIKKWYATVDLRTLVGYNETDCVILYKAIERFQDELLELGGELQKTVASSAMNLYRRSYLRTPITTNDEINNEARESYFASRVEVFNSECHGGYYYDINSSFPHSMTYPVPGTYRGKSHTFSESWLDNDYMPFFARIDFTVPEMYFPPIPTRQGGRVFFPVGRWQAFLSSIDIRLLLQCGGIIHSVDYVRKFEPHTDLRDYVLDIYTRRQKSTDPFQRIVYKYLLNSLYGKFAESKEKEALLIHPDPMPNCYKGICDNPKERNNCLGGRKCMLTPGVYVTPKEGKVPHEHVPISSYVTARSRALLYDYMAESNVFHYCDTDGFSTESNHYKTVETLGGLKLEKIIDYAAYLAPKVYGIEGTIDGEKKTLVRAKGFSLGKNEKEAITRFSRLVWGLDIQVDRMARIRENFRKGRLHPIETTVSKKLIDQIPKRFTYEDGTTRPWTMKEILLQE